MDRAQDALRRLRAIASMSSYQAAPGAFMPGTGALDLPAIARGAVHEFFSAAKADAPAAAGFVTGLAFSAGDTSRPALWVRHASRREGLLYGGGFAALGLDPNQFIHLPVEDEKDGLRATLEGLRCKGLSSVILEIAGPARHLDLTATRRLKLAAADHEVTALILRHGADPGPSAAQTRWQIATSLSASPGLGLPGRPAFTVKLLKHPSAGTGRSWDLEWDHEKRQFTTKTISRPLAALSFDRTHRASGEGVRARAG